MCAACVLPVFCVFSFSGMIDRIASSIQFQVPGRRILVPEDCILNLTHPALNPSNSSSRGIRWMDSAACGRASQQEGSHQGQLRTQPPFPLEPSSFIALSNSLLDRVGWRGGGVGQSVWGIAQPERSYRKQNGTFQNRPAFGGRPEWTYHNR